MDFVVLEEKVVTSKFNIGDSIVCVDPTGNLIINREYVVTDVRVAINGLCVVLDGVSNKEGTIGFLEDRFILGKFTNVRLNQIDVDSLVNANYVLGGLLNDIVRKIN